MIRIGIKIKVIYSIFAGLFTSKFMVKAWFIAFAEKTNIAQYLELRLSVWNWGSVSGTEAQLSGTEAQCLELRLSCLQVAFTHILDSSVSL
mgnify:CR=1 FL=1